MSSHWRVGRGSDAMGMGSSGVDRGGMGAGRGLFCGLAGAVMLRNHYFGQFHIIQNLASDY